ncbi:MAG: sulfite exporter TauE/SafE family protein [Proteobacteria bacterium]|nr:sulfite exporter TauE/SafE family protein [Pseudomonadota bacterium]
MDQDFLILNIAVFGASALQAATGIGFGIIAGPVLLIALNDGSAIQISILLNLLIAVILTPSLWREADRRLLSKLLIGLSIGSPLGLLIFLSMDIIFLKAFAGLAVVFTLILILRGTRALSPAQQSDTGKFEQISVGIMSGIMGASLAMPGPIPAAWMSPRGFSKETIRATILLMFVFAYLVALALQYGMAGISAESFRLCAVLAPSTIVGILLGQSLSSRLTEQTSRWLLVIILAATAIILFATLI